MAVYLVEQGDAADKLRTGISKESRDVLEGLAFLVLLVVGIMSGMLLEQRWSAIERRQDAYETRQLHTDKQLKKVEDIMWGGIQ